MAIERWTAYQTADTAIASSDLNALASGTAAANFKLGAAIDNTRSGSTLGWPLGDLELVFRDATPADATITAGSGSPFLAVYIIPSLDGGTRYATTNAAQTAGPTSPQYLSATIQVPASAAVGTLIARGLVLPPGFFKIMINNQLGASFTASNNNLCRLYRYSAEGV